MSIATSLDKLSETLTNCKTNLKEKGVESDNIKISDVDEKIAEIQSGGGLDVENPKYITVSPDSLYLFSVLDPPYELEGEVEITVDLKNYQNEEDSSIYCLFGLKDVECELAEPDGSYKNNFVKYGLFEATAKQETKQKVKLKGTEPIMSFIICLIEWSYHTKLIDIAKVNTESS